MSQYFYTVLYLSFAENVIIAIAWPVVVLTVLLVFRSQLEELTARLKRVSLAGNEVDFSDDLIRFAKDVDKAGIEAPASSIKELRNTDIQLAILRTYSEIEEIIGSWFERGESNRFATQASGRAIKPVSTRARIRFLNRHEVFDDETSILIERLNDLRNHAAHSTNFHVHSAEAFDFLKASQGLKSKIKLQLSKT